MTVRPPRADDALGAEGEAEWERLSRQAELASGFWLGFVFVPSGRVAGVLRARLEKKLAEEEKVILVIRPAAPFRLKGAVQTLMERGGKPGVGCIWLEAVYTDVLTAAEKPWESAWREMLIRANEQRDALRATMKHGLVLVAPPNVKPLVRELAPDLWHVRALVSGIAAEPAPARTEDSAIFELPRLAVKAPAWRGTMLGVGASPSKAALSRPDPPSSQPARKRPSERPPPQDDRAQRVSTAGQLVAEAERALDEAEHRKATMIALRAAASLEGLDPLVESRAWMIAAIAKLNEADPAAAEYAEKAIEVRRRADPSAVPVAWLIVRASALMKSGRADEARRALVDAYHHGRDRHRQSPNLETALDLADVLCWTGELLLPDDAARATLALEEAHRLITSVDLSQDAALPRRNLEMLVRLGDAYRQLGRDADAEAVFSLGAGTAAERISETSTDTAALRDASVLYNRLGTVQLASGDTAHAIDVFQRAAALRRRVLDAVGSDRAKSDQALTELVSALDKLLSALRAAGREPDAKAVAAEIDALRRESR